MVIRWAVCLKIYKSFVILKMDNSLQEAVTKKGPCSEKNYNFIVTEAIEQVALGTTSHFKIK